MGKQKQSRIQEGFLIAFVAVCFALVAVTLWIAFDEARVGPATQEYYGGISPYGTLSPSVVVPTTRPHGNGGGGGGEHEDEHDAQPTATISATVSPTDSAIDRDRQATLRAESDAQQQGLAY